MEVLILILFGVCSIPFIVMLVGIFMLFSKNERTKKSGKNTLLAGFIILGVGLIIGTLLCSFK
jgi:uncharacterized membrane protein